MKMRPSYNQVGCDSLAGELYTYRVYMAYDPIARINNSNIDSSTEPVYQDNIATIVTA